MASILDDGAMTSDRVRGREFRMLVGNELRQASDGGARPTIDPSTGRVLAHVPEGTAVDVAAAVAAGEAAQPAWEALGTRGRGEVFEQLAQAVVANREELALLDALDCGNPLPAMRLDVDISVHNIRHWPLLAYGLHGEVVDASPGNLHYTRFRPYGVVGRIVAFNHPGMFAMTRILAALIAGNTVVLKPGVQTPLSALAFGEVAREVLPPGVLNIVSGGAQTGDALVTHPRVKRLGFTGSEPTGRLIQQRAATAAVKHVSLELGGKNAMVVMPDADLGRVVDSAAAGMNLEVCQGQSCGSNSRILVHARVHDEFVGRLSQRVAGIRVAAAYAEEADMGPLVSDDHRSRVHGFVQRAAQAGASVVTGGDRPAGTDEAGYFLAPTVLAGVQAEMEIAQDEVFGPVVSVLRWSDYDQMLRTANGVDFGLTASVWTRDLDVAHRTAELLDAGYVWVNDSSRHYFGTPFGGTKDSGTGREESVEELHSYVEPKAVHVRLATRAQAAERVSSWTGGVDDPGAQ